MRRYCLQRPSDFRIDPTHYLARGLVFAGLAPGGMVGSTRYHDSSLYGRHGTMVGMDPPTDWVFDPTLGRFVVSFGGTNEYIVTPLVAPNKLPSTVSMWLYLDSLTVTHGPFCTARVVDKYVGQFCSITATTGAINNSIGNNGGQGPQGRKTFATSNGISSGQWYHCIFCAETVSSLPVYVNGVSWSGSYTGNATTYSIGAATTAWIGAFEGSPDTFTTGKIGDYIVWNRVLSPAEIQQLADPSNVLLSGLILPPKRQIFATYTSTTQTTDYKVYRKMNYYRKLRSF